MGEPPRRSGELVSFMSRRMPDVPLFPPRGATCISAKCVCCQRFNHLYMTYSVPPAAPQGHREGTLMLDTEQGVLLICGHCWPTDQDSPGVADGRHQGPIYAYGCDCSPAHLCPPWGRQFVCPGLSSSMRARFPRVAEMESKEVPPTVRLADRFICSEQSAEAFLKQLRFTRERPAHAKSPLPLVPSKRALEAAAPASSGGFEHTMRHLAMDGTPRPPAVTSRSHPGQVGRPPPRPSARRAPPTAHP